MALCGSVSASSNLTLTSHQQSQVMNTQIPFVENNGQTEGNVSYYADTFYGTAFVTDNGISHSIKGANNNILVVKEEFLDANGKIITFKANGVEEANTKVDFYTGNDPRKWKTAQSTWNIISLGELYPGITVFLRAHGSNVEKIFIIEPGANPNNINIQITGADSLTINSDGDLNIASVVGDVQLTKPVAYQEEQTIEVTYRLSNYTYGFQTGTYNQEKTLTIDPILKYSTYLGGTGFDTGSGIALDGSGNIYITGSTYSTDFLTTTGAYQNTKKGSNSPDVFVSKLAPNGQGTSDLKYTTYLGGTNHDFGSAITVDSSGNIYITGYTNSTNFPTTTGAYQTTKKGFASSYDTYDVFVSKLAPNGQGTNDLKYSTYLGGIYMDKGQSIALDGSGYIYITGYTNSEIFPTTSGAYQTKKKRR